MNVAPFPAPIRPLPLQAATQRLWQLRRLIGAGAVDPRAADLALRPLRTHPNARVAALATQTTNEITQEQTR